MRHSRRSAFTLPELMVVVLMIGILLALLLPALDTVWQTADLTRCQNNLATLYKAQGVWNANRIAYSSNSSGADGWAGSLLSYLEGRAGALMCPSLNKAAATGSTGTPGGGSGGGTTDPALQDEGSMDTPMELDQVTIGVTKNDGTLVYEIPLGASSYWTMYQTWPVGTNMMHIGANIDGYMAQGADGRYSDEDFQFTVQYDGQAHPIKVTVGDCDGNGDQYWTDMRVNHKPIWGGQRFLLRFGEGHIGETIDLQREAKQNGTGQPNVTWTIWSGSLGTLGMTNYGINRGCFQDKFGRDVHNADPKLFFILDYPRPVVDMTDINDGKQVPDKLYWSQIFIDPAPPPEGKWSPPPKLEGWSWEQVQALRHLGTANVLFCDGHIESLGADDLSPTSPYWRYIGR